MATDALSQEARSAAFDELERRIQTGGIERVRFAWCDLHGALRSKVLMAPAAIRALRSGIGMPGTLMLKDHADKTAFPVFDAQQLAPFPGLAPFAQAANVQLIPDPTAFWTLPWDASTGCLRCEPWFPDGTPVSIDARRVLKAALARLDARGWSLQCGLEVEFHVYRIKDASAQTDPMLTEWPGRVPQLEMLHPGYRLMGDDYMTQCEAPMAIIENTALALGLPLHSLEIEFGPSQFEAVFDVTDALSAADNMVLFRNMTRQALRRAGYYASFVCRPPFPNIMSSGWHLHQSLVDAEGRNLFMRDAGEPCAIPVTEARECLSEHGAQYLAGLLAHAQAMAPFCVPTLNGYERFRPNALAPQLAVWGHDNRGAMLRVVGGPGDAATRIENRLGEPMANPYLYMASQVHAGLDGIDQQMQAPPSSNSPYAGTEAQAALPTSLDDALQALQDDEAMVAAFGSDLVHYLTQIARSGNARFWHANDPDEFQAREYFGRY